MKNKTWLLLALIGLVLTSCSNASKIVMYQDGKIAGAVVPNNIDANLYNVGDTVVISHGSNTYSRGVSNIIYGMYKGSIPEKQYIEFKYDTTYSLRTYTKAVIIQ